MAVKVPVEWNCFFIFYRRFHLRVLINRYARLHSNTRAALGYAVYMYLSVPYTLTRSRPNKRDLSYYICVRS